ncbi:MAG: hypothetical protein F6K65_34520 [Moorea sp. SIO3C2]|nr:hypothetical protein [Moorena sp. SIO3C2]
MANIDLNNARNIIPYNLSISDYIGEARLCISEKSHTGINAISTDYQNNSAYTIAPCCTGDVLLMPFLVSDSSIVIKVDVEGAEFLVLSGMFSCLKKTNIKSVIVEMTPKYLKGFGHTKEDISVFHQ